MMTFIERSIKPTNPVPVEAPGLTPDAGYRVRKALGIVGEDSRGRVIEIANALVPDILAGVNAIPHTARLAEEEPIAEMWAKDDKYVMTAVHILSIAGYDSDYGPLRDGKREIKTKFPTLLHGVNTLLEDVAGRVDASMPQALDEKTRDWATTHVMDEVSYSVFGALRDERDVRRQREKTQKEEAVMAV